MAFAAMGAGCGDDDDGGTVIDSGTSIDSGDPDAGSVPGVLKGPSKSSTIALSDDGTLVIMSNPEADSVSIFKTSDNTLLKTVPTGKEPFAVVIGPDSKTAYVANRADATVVKLTAIDTANPVVGTPVNVGSEPTGLALSPTGAKLFVAEFAEGRVSVINTAAMTLGTSVALRNPRAVAVTNDGDADDSDETVIVTEFYGQPVAGKEAQDDGRTGQVRLYKASDLSTDGNISFAVRDSTFGANAAAGTTMTSPNQLSAIGVQGNRIFIPATAASPGGAPNFSQNVFPIVYVGNLSTRMEDTTAAGTTNLARKVYDKIPSPSATAPRFIPGDIVDISFVPGLTVSYIVARTGEIVQRTVWGATVDIGSTQVQQIDMNVAVGTPATPCQNPNGIVIQSSMRGYVNCWGSKVLGVLDLQNQALLTTVKSSDPSATDTAAVRRGRHFYFTGRGRWSKNVANGAKGGEGWSSCGSCHPDGLSDNITWTFGTGPRQTTSQDGSFSHRTGMPQKQRIFNWTGVFDEHHDFERNTRGVSGGIGAITKAPTPADCGNLAMETVVQLTTDAQPPATPPANVIGGLGRPFKELAADAALNPTLCIRTDWDDIDEYVKTIRPARAIRFPDATASVSAGRTVFSDQGCAKCHGGAGWTLSRRFWTPSLANNNALAARTMSKPLTLPTGPWVGTWNVQTNDIQVQQIVTDTTTGFAEAATVAPPQVGCTIRNVGTFGDRMNATFTDALEKKDDGARAQGRGGYNIPSLYGLAMGAPYLHHGQAATLDALFTDTRWDFHTQAGAANPMTAQQRKDLIAFLLSIDPSVDEFAIPSNGTPTPTTHDACPAVFP